MQGSWYLKSLGRIICRNKTAHMRSKRQYPAKSCSNPACKSKYQPHDFRQIFCSTQCRINYHNDSRREKSNTLYFKEKLLRHKAKALRDLYNSPNYRKEKKVSGEALLFLNILPGLTTDLEINSQTKRMIYWAHDMGLEPLTTKNDYFEIHQRTPKK